MTIGPDDEALRQLLLVRPDEFVAARNALAKSLRADKRREDADVVAKLRRPSWPDHALNVVADTEPEMSSAFVAAAAALRAAQAAAVEGDGTGLGPAMRQFREAQRPIVTAANRVLRSRGRAPDGPAVSARLVELAASDDADPRLDLFGAAIDATPSEAPGRARARRTPARDTSDARQRPSEIELAARRKRVRLAERDHRNALTVVERAANTLHKATAALADAQREVDAAAAALADAEAGAAAAAAELDDARRAADQPTRSGG